MDMTELLRLLGLRQAYDAYQRNIGQPVANVAGPFGRGFLGLQQPEYGSEEAYRTGQAVGNMPGPNVPAGAIKMAAQVPGLLDALQAAKNSPELTGLLGLTAYHGSPYRFSKFDPTKIGTGEGAQAYGYGHYFAEAPEVAKGYRDKLSTNVTVDGAKLQTIPSDSPMATAQNMIITNIQSGMSPQEAIAATNKYWTDAANEMLGFAKSNPELVGRIEKEAASRMEVANAANSVKPGSFYRDPGSFYTVDIPDEMIGRMLDWDKPLGQQSETIQRLAKQVGLEMEDLGGDLVARFDAKRPEGAELLRQQGIPGVQYYDQASRPSDITSRKLVDLYNKYGDIDKAVDEMMRTVHNTQKEKQKIREQFVEKLQTGLTRNFVVFPGEEEAIKMLKVE